MYCSIKMYKSTMIIIKKTRINNALFNFVVCVSKTLTFTFPLITYIYIYMKTDHYKTAAERRVRRGMKYKKTRRRYPISYLVLENFDGLFVKTYERHRVTIQCLFIIMFHITCFQERF